MNRRFGLAPLIGLIFATLVLSGCNNPFGEVSGTGDSVELADTSKQVLTVDPSDLLPDGAQCKSNVFLDYAIRSVEKGNPEARDNTHAPSIPMKAKDKNAALSEIMAEHCGNPTVLYMSLKALSTWQFGEWKLVEHNPWISDFLGVAENKGLRTTTLSYKSKDSKDIIVTVDYQKTAAMANTLLMRAQNAGFIAAPSVTNWFVKGDDKVGELPLAVSNPQQEGLPALRLEFTEKGTGCFAAFGYNLFDKRFETFKCKEAVPTPSSSAPTGGSTPSGKPTPTATPTCVEIPGNGKVDCGGAKDPGEDPQSQGNVPTQVQGSNPPVTSGPSSPAVPEPTAAYTPPATPTPTPVPTTVRPVPPPPAPSPSVTETGAPPPPNW